jgi:molybdopterin adenylyltransferase
VTVIPAVGVLTVSDRASRGDYEDRGGPAIRAYLDEALTGPWRAVAQVVSDDRDVVEAALRRMVDDEGCCLVVTTGGTGPAPRDVTPEATEAVCDRMLPGFGEAMRAESLRHVPTAVLSRQTAGHRGACLIVNLPGKPAAIRECLDAVWGAIPYCVDLIGGPRLESPAAFRPGGA